MHSPDLLILLTGLSVLFSVLNHRFLKLPFSTASMLMVAVLFGAFYTTDYFFSFSHYILEPDLSNPAHYRPFVEVGVGSLLFVSALQINYPSFGRLKWFVLLLLAGGGLLFSLLTGGLLYLFLQILQYKVSFFHTLLFGFLIAPLDPITLKPVLQKAGIRGNRERFLTIEALFTGIAGVTGFYMILDHVQDNLSGAPWLYVVELLGVNVLGGILLGVVLGLTGRWLLKQVHGIKANPEVLIIPVLVVGGVRIANNFQLFWPLAMVVFGLVLRKAFLQFKDTQGIAAFPDLLYELFTNMFFLMGGLALLVIDISCDYLLAGGMAILVVLFSRISAVLTLLKLMFYQKRDVLSSARLLSWGAIRGGIPLALVLTIPAEQDAKDLMLVLTSCVVVFSVLIQGSTLSCFVQRKVKNKFK